jgi:glycosyltransferase involved in cell wall biosynthesis
MDQPLVSILMPVYNSSDFARSGGYNLLPKLLDSLLDQSYNNFELVILDNQSTDNTSAICKAYAAKDPRITYILDSQKRFPEGAVTYLASSFVRGKYCMGANDDDIYDPDFLNKMIGFLEKNPHVDMVYSNGSFIDLVGRRLSRIIRQDHTTYNETSSTLSNYCVYIQNRNVIPVCFGVYRSEVFCSLLPFEYFDNLKANVDNLFLAKFFLKGFRCHFIDEDLFFYRWKTRGLEVKSSTTINGIPPLDKPHLVWMYYIRHQFLFYRKLDESLHNNGFTGMQYLYARGITFNSFIRHSLSLLDWINNSYIHTTRDKKRNQKIVSFIQSRFDDSIANAMMTMTIFGFSPRL